MVSVVFLAIYRPSYFYGIQRCSYGSVSDCMKMNLKVQSVELRYDLSEHFWGYEQFASCAIFRIAIGLKSAAVWTSRTPSSQIFTDLAFSLRVLNSLTRLNDPRNLLHSEICIPDYCPRNFQSEVAAVI